MKLDAAALAHIRSVTLEQYEKHATDFWRGTRNHDVSQNVDALLQYIEAKPPFTVLDFGCGPGRDLKEFAARGHTAIGLEGANTFVEMARTYSGCEVWHQDFLALRLPAARFDGIFANATLFHVPTQELPRVLRALHATLKPGGTFFASNPHGHDEEGWHAGRYGAYHSPETWRGLVTAAGFIELTHYFRPTGLPRRQQPWFATVWRKSASPR